MRALCLLMADVAGRGAPRGTEGMCSQTWLRRNKRDNGARGEAAPLGTEGCNPAARLLRLGRRGTILRRGRSERDEGVFCLKSTLDALPAVFDDDGVTRGIVQATALEVEDLTRSGGRFADGFDGGGATLGVILLDVEEVLPACGALIGFLAAEGHVEDASRLVGASQGCHILLSEVVFQGWIGDRQCRRHASLHLYRFDGR